MTPKEKTQHLIDKWDFMLEPLDKKKTSQARFAKLFESTVLHSNTSTMKITLPLLQKLLYNIPTIKSSASSKTKYLLGEDVIEAVIDGNTIMPDGASAFINRIIKEAVENIDDISKMNHLMVTTTNGKIKVYLLY